MIRLCFWCLLQPSVLKPEQLDGQDCTRSVAPGIEWVMKYFRFSGVSLRSSSVRLRSRLWPLAAVPSKVESKLQPQTFL